MSEYQDDDEPRHSRASRHSIGSRSKSKKNKKKNDFDNLEDRAMDDEDIGYSSRRRLKDNDKSKERSRSRKSSKKSRKSRAYSNMDNDIEDSGESDATMVDAP